MAMIPTMMASTPIRINEVDDDLSTDFGRGVDVDVAMKGAPFASFGFPFVWPVYVAAAFGPGCVEAMVPGEAATSQYCWAGPTRGRVRKPQPLGRRRRACRRLTRLTAGGHA